MTVLGLWRRLTGIFIRDYNEGYVTQATVTRLNRPDKHVGWEGPRWRTPAELKEAKES